MQHRKVLEDLAQTDFQVALAALNSEIDKLVQMDDAVIQAREAAFSSQAAGGKASASLTQVHEFLKGQDIRRERQKEKGGSLTGLKVLNLYFEPVYPSKVHYQIKSSKR